MNSIRDLSIQPFLFESQSPWVISSAPPVLPALPAPPVLPALPAPPVLPALPAGPMPVLLAPPSARALFLWRFEQRLRDYDRPFRVAYVPRCGTIVYSGGNPVMGCNDAGLKGTRLIQWSAGMRPAKWAEHFALYMGDRAMYDLLMIVCDRHNRGLISGYQILS